MPRPLIGIAPDFNPASDTKGGEREAILFIKNRYVAAVEAAGGIPLILPIVRNPALCAALLKSLDGLLLTGSGPDIDPRRYGERQRFTFKVMSPERTESEYALVIQARKRDLPVLGICGGMQLMTVALGGTLIQDIDKQVEDPLQHRMTGPATGLCHGVRIARGSRLSEILGRDVFQVNSSHHQAVRTVPRTLKVSASASDGVIEAVEDPSRRFFLGVQWHPEYLYRRYPAHRAIFGALVSAASQPRALPATRSRARA
jgi:putative glutamine amidotransferase